MPLIPYPDVPNVPGVPQLPVAPSSYVYPATGAPESSLDSSDTYLGNQYQQWSITDQNGSPIIQMDSVIDFEYRGEMRIPHYPVEQGGFASYNKVAMPFDIRMTVACNGNGQLPRSEFLSQIETLKNGLDLISINTPDVSYPSCNLVHVDYRREARKGVTLLIAQLWLVEVRETATATITTAQPDGAKPAATGQVSPVSPTPAQTAAAATTLNHGASGSWASGATGAW